MPKWLLITLVVVLAIVFAVGLGLGQSDGGCSPDAAVGCLSDIGPSKPLVPSSDLSTESRKNCRTNDDDDWFEIEKSDLLEIDKSSDEEADPCSDDHCGLGISTYSDDRELVLRLVQGSKAKVYFAPEAPPEGEKDPGSFKTTATLEGKGDEVKILVPTRGGQGCLVCPTPATRKCNRSDGSRSKYDCCKVKIVETGGK